MSDVFLTHDRAILPVEDPAAVGEQEVVVAVPIVVTEREVQNATAAGG